MEIELPDGTVLDAPDDADIKKVVQGYRAAQAKKNTPDPTELMSPLQRSIAQLQLGVINTGRNIRDFTANIGANELAAMGDMDMPAKIRKGVQEQRAEEDRLDEPLRAAKGGTVLPLVGGMVATAPTTALSTPSRLGTAALQGGVQAALTRGGDESAGTAPLKGAVLSMAIDSLFRGGGRIISGLVKKSKAAEDLLSQADLNGVQMELPLAAAADDSGISGVIKKTYKNIIPAIPGAGQMLDAQNEAAAKKLAEVAAKEATPMGGVTPAGDMEDVVSNLGSQFSKLYKDKRNWAFNVPKDIGPQVEAKVRAKFPNIDDEALQQTVDAAESAMSRFSNGGKVIDGDNLQNVMNFLHTEGRKATKAGEQRLGQALYEAASVVDDHIAAELSQGGVQQNLQALAEAQQLPQSFSNFKVLKKAATKAKDVKGNFTPAQLASAAPPGSPLLKLAQAGKETIGDGKEMATPLRQAIGTMGLVTGQIMGGPALPVAAGGLALATKTAQRALLGDTAAQLAMKKLYEQNPELFKQVVASVRQAGVVGEQ